MDAAHHEVNTHGPASVSPEAKEAVVDDKTTQISLWPGVRFTEEERRSILAQLDRIANPDAARRARWNRISDAREAFMATLEPQHTTNG